MSRIDELIARAKARTAEITAEKLKVTEQTSIAAKQAAEKINNNLSKLELGGIDYNTEQQAFINLVLSGANSILIGAAGTGKTTTMKGTIAAILQSKYMPTLSDSHRHLPIGTPGIVACSYTRRSVSNLRKAMPEDMKGNCITIHKLLEYFPEFYSVLDPETGEYRTTMQFKPARGNEKPLDRNIKLIIIDEASTVSLELHTLLTIALHHQIQIIYLGDINQLPPTFGSAILGYKGVELKDSTVELKQVYRQALESPIIRLAHRILSGKVIESKEFPEWHVPGKLLIKPWTRKIGAEHATIQLSKFFKTEHKEGNYDPEQDIILIPFNVGCGTVELNKYIANHLARTQNRTTYEIQAGYNKLYLSVGDIVMYDKEDAIVVAINHNGMYGGRWPQSASKHLDYWGHKQEGTNDSEETEDEFDARVDSLIAIAGAETNRTTEASHTVTIVRKEDGEEIVLNSAAELNNIALGYCLTVHKSQGSEWRKVYCVFHQSHATMIQRELLYTAVTRAREELVIICEPETFVNGIKSQKIKGETLAEKFEIFKGKMATRAELN